MTPASPAPQPEEPDATHRSVWMDTGGEAPRLPTLTEDIDVQVAIVGSGIVGLTAAAELAEAGLDVALIEKGQVAGGVTSHSTAKLTSNHGIIYQDIAKAFGKKKARQYATANQNAIEHVANESQRRGIDADIHRHPHITYTDQPGSVQRVQREVEVAEDLGLPVRSVDDVPIDTAEAGIQFDDQAHFHPRKYLLGLVRDLEGTVRFYENTRATGMGRDDGRPVVKTDHGKVMADDVVVASHFPFHDPGFYFARLIPRYSYLLSVELSEPAPEGMYYRVPDPYFTFRPHPNGAQDQALVGGLNHRTGEGENALELVQRIRQQAERVLPIERVTHYWSTQDYESIDGVPMVGPIRPGADHVLVATGFGGWGLSNGTAAGLLLASTILGEELEWGEVYDPSRFKAGKSAKPMWSHNKHAMRHWFKDRLGITQLPGENKLASLAPGQAQVVDTSEGPVAAYRDDDGTLYTPSAICTHMQCNVEWNGEARSWDCPCHGSRFDVDGTLIDGPATKDLESKDVGEAADGTVQDPLRT